MSPPLRVVVASNDATFVRLAAVALARRGQHVRTVRLAGTRLAFVLTEGLADVIVLDDAGVAAQVRQAIADARLPIGVVEVHEEGQGGVTKFGPLAELAAEVEAAGQRVSDPALVSEPIELSARSAAHLRIVT